MKDEGPCEHTQMTEAVGLGCPMGNELGKYMLTWQLRTKTPFEHVIKSL